MSPAWPQRKHLSTLPEEDGSDDGDGLTSRLSDDDLEPDVFVEAVLMPVENLGSLARTMVSHAVC